MSEQRYDKQRFYRFLWAGVRANGAVSIKNNNSIIFKGLTAVIERSEGKIKRDFPRLTPWGFAQVGSDYGLLRLNDDNMLETTFHSRGGALNYLQKIPEEDQKLFIEAGKNFVEGVKTYSSSVKT